MVVQRRRLHPDDHLHPQRALTVALVGSLFLLPAARAAGQISVEVSPLRVEISGAPGASQTQAVTLRNQSDRPVRIRATVDDWSLSKDGTPQFSPAPPDTWTSASAWMRLAPPEQVVEPGQQAVVRFTLTVPADTPDGGYRTAVLFDFGAAENDLASRGRQVTFRSRVATVVYVTVGQPLVVVSLANLTVQPDPDGRLQAVATLANRGRVHVRTKGVLTVYGQAGTVVRQLDLPSAPVLPESERDVAVAIEVDGQPRLAPGTYRVEVRIDVGARELLVGETTLAVAR
jgi:P pilus assembly chaperone PapD